MGSVNSTTSWRLNGGRDLQSLTPDAEYGETQNQSEQALEQVRKSGCEPQDSTTGTHLESYRLGVFYENQYRRLGELDDLDKAIKYMSRVLALAPDNHPDLSDWLTSLGKSHSNRFQRIGEPDDIMRAIEYMSRAVAMTPDGHRSLPQRLASLGAFHSDRYQCLGEIDDNTKAIEYGNRALTLTPIGHDGLPDRLTDLAMSYNDRFERFGELSDIEKAIQYTSRALSLTPHGHADMTRRLASLGLFHSSRFRCLGELDDIQKAIEYESRVIDLTPSDHPSLPDRLLNLGASYNIRFKRLGDLDDLGKTIEFMARAVALTPKDQPDLKLSLRLANLGVAYGERFKRLGDPDDVEKEIEYKTRAINLVPHNHPDLPRQFNSLGMSYGHRFHCLGKPNDLEKAIEYKSHTLALTPDDHPNLPNWLVSLGVSYNDRFKHMGELDDIDKAIEYESRALALTPKGHPELSNRFSSLGASYSDRFRRLGELHDIERAIKCTSEAISLTPDRHPNLPYRLTTLGLSHGLRFEHQNLSHELVHIGVFQSNRFKHLSELDDLEKAIQCISRALALTPNGHPYLPQQLANLGISHRYRFQCLDKLADIEKSIEYETRALALTPKGHPNMLYHLCNLGASHATRFQRAGDTDDMKKAIEYTSRALALTPDDHPTLPLQHFSLARLCFDQSQRTGDLSDLQNSLNYFRKATAQSSIGTPRDKITSALYWATLASQHSRDSSDCIEAYQAAINLLPQFVWLGATTNQRYQDLELAQTLATRAASAAIRSSDYKLALEWLESARCVVWNQSLMLRSPLDQLQPFHPDLAARLRTVADELGRAGSESQTLRTLTPSPTNPEQIAQQHRRLAKEYSELISQAREVPGFEDFLQPMNATGLVRAARYGPIVIINCGESQCDAIVILPEQNQVHSIPLETFSREKAQRARNDIIGSLKRKGIRERGAKPDHEPQREESFKDVLKILWNDIVKPVLDFLGYTEATPTDPPHITWYPTGTISFLPLHAAGDYDQPGSRVFDYVVSSYTPTLTALLASVPFSLSHDSKVLAIGQATTPGHGGLPGTAKELASFKLHTQNKFQYSQLVDSQATTTAVLDAMEQHDWVHLACHAHQNVGDATESGFFLHDGVLDLASINRRSFIKKGLAFLSACQTAKGDEKLPDEAVHLASGMLMAGYTSVIATMWSVRDEDAPLVADKVYAQLMKDGKLGNGEAGKALHNAVAELREKVGEEDFESWVPYIHIGS